MELVNQLNDRLLFAVPKKGRLQQKSLDLLAGSDIQFHRHNRLDIALVINHPIAIVFLPAADIPSFVGEGRVDLGITGRDQLAEHEAIKPPTATTGAEEIMDLGFGRCKLQVQVPTNGGIQRAEQLIGKNVATSFVNLTKAYFRQLESKHQPPDATTGDAGETRLRTEIQLVTGSVESSCALGLADGVVDLVESGETMRAAGLEVVDTVVESTAVLLRSKHPSNPELVSIITNRIKGIITAQKFVLCTYNVERTNLARAKEITPGRRAPTISSLDDEPGWVAVSVMVERAAIANVMDELTGVGATDIMVTKLENTRGL